jgi:hypothetical protein
LSHEEREGLYMVVGRPCYTRTIRYPKSVEITELEAESIIATSGASLSDMVVISDLYRWPDVRSMTRGELQAVVAGLARAEITAADAQMSMPS